MSPEAPWKGSKRRILILKLIIPVYITFKVMPEVFLKVDSAYPEDQGAGKVRLDPETMLQLRLSPGNIVYIEGKRRTVAKVWRSMVSTGTRERSGWTTSPGRTPGSPSGTG
jgi:hypothetical protein